MKEERCKYCNKLLVKGRFIGRIERLGKRWKQMNKIGERQGCQSK